MEMDIPWVTHQHHTMPTLTKKLKVGDSVRSIVFDNEEPWPLQGEVGTVKDQRCRNALIPKPDAEESGARQWKTQSTSLATSSLEYLKDRWGYCYNIYLWFYLHSLSTLFSYTFSYSLQILFYHFLLLSSSIFSLSITQLSIIQPSITQLFYYSALLLSDISTSINTLDFHL